MEQRLIDANALIEILAGMQAVCHTHAELVGISKVWQQVKHMPTIEAEPVIRCKECVYFTPEKNGEHWNSCRFYDAPKTAYGYCNDAEPKEKEK